MPEMQNILPGLVKWVAGKASLHHPNFQIVTAWMTVNNLFKRSVSSTEDPAILCRQTGQKWEIRMLLGSVEDTCKMLSLQKKGYVRNTCFK